MRVRVAAKSNQPARLHLTRLFPAHRPGNLRLRLRTAFHELPDLAPHQGIRKVF